MTLYQNIVMDVDPLQSITSLTNKCFIKGDIQQFDPLGQSGKFFFDQICSEQFKNSTDYSKFMETNQKDQDKLKKYVSFLIDTESPVCVAKESSDEVYQSKKKLKFQLSKLNGELVINSYIDIFLYDDGYPPFLVIEEFENLDLYCTYQLEYFLELLKIVNLSVKLGYNNVEKNESIQSVILNVFFSLILKNKLNDQETKELL